MTNTDTTGPENTIATSGMASSPGKYPVYASCGLTADDSGIMEIMKVNLIIDSLPEETGTTATELDPGALVAVGQRKHVELDVPYVPKTGTMVLASPPNVDTWQDADAQYTLSLPRLWDFTNQADRVLFGVFCSTGFWIEGKSPGAGNVVLTYYGMSAPYSDVVKVTVPSVEILSVPSFVFANSGYAIPIQFRVSEIDDFSITGAEFRLCLYDPDWTLVETDTVSVSSDRIAYSTTGTGPWAPIAIGSAGPNEDGTMQSSWTYEAFLPAGCYNTEELATDQPSSDFAWFELVLTAEKEGSSVTVSPLLVDPAAQIGQYFVDCRVPVIDARHKDNPQGGQNHIEYPLSIHGIPPLAVCEALTTARAKPNGDLQDWYPSYANYFPDRKWYYDVDGYLPPHDEFVGPECYDYNLPLNGYSKPYWYEGTVPKYGIAGEQNDVMGGLGAVPIFYCGPSWTVTNNSSVVEGGFGVQERPDSEYVGEFLLRNLHNRRGLFFCVSYGPKAIPGVTDTSRFPSTTNEWAMDTSASGSSCSVDLEFMRANCVVSTTRPVDPGAEFVDISLGGAGIITGGLLLYMNAPGAALAAAELVLGTADLFYGTFMGTGTSLRSSSAYARARIGYCVSAIPAGSSPDPWNYDWCYSTSIGNAGYDATGSSPDVVAIVEENMAVGKQFAVSATTDVIGRCFGGDSHWQLIPIATTANASITSTSGVPMIKCYCDSTRGP